jgi:hypothetical protein
LGIGHRKKGKRRIKMGTIENRLSQWKKPKTFLEARGKSKEFVVSPRWDPRSVRKPVSRSVVSGYIPAAKVLASSGIVGRSVGLLKVSPGKPVRLCSHLDEGGRSEKEKAVEVKKTEMEKKVEELNRLQREKRDETVQVMESEEVKAVEEKNFGVGENGVISSQQEKPKGKKNRKKNKHRREEKVEVRVEEVSLESESGKLGEVCLPELECPKV